MYDNKDEAENPFFAKFFKSFIIPFVLAISINFSSFLGVYELMIF